MSEKLERLSREIEKTEAKLRRKERTHRLCTRGAMLESYFPHPEAVTDEQVSQILRVLFHQEAARQLMESILAKNPQRE